MSTFISVKSYDGTIVRIPKEKLKEFNLKQKQIKEMLDNGKSLEDIKIVLKKVHYDE